ncbi:MAG: CpaF family protein, partial [Angustibacter sp.]
MRGRFSEGFAGYSDAPATRGSEAGDTDQRLVEQFKARLLDEVDLYELGRLDSAQRRVRLERVMAHLVSREGIILSSRERNALIRRVVDEAVGLGVLEPLLSDETISEIMINGHREIYVERFGQLQKVASGFTSEEQLLQTIDRMVSTVNRRVDESSPMVDARLPPDARMPRGARVHVVLPPLALNGPTVTIRLFPKAYGLDELLARGSLDQQTARLLAACVRARLNIIVSGGTASGKTTMLNALSAFIPNSERIITIEDAAELSLSQEHLIRLETRPPNVEGRGQVSIRDLVRNALRMRPDRIIVGEVRDASALDMLQAMNTGHDGSICTLHSNGPRDTLARMETMVLMAGMDLPVRAIREQVASAVDLIVHQTRFKDGSRKLTHLTEVERMEGDVITLQDIFVYDHSAGFDENGKTLGRLRATGLRPKFLEKLAHANVQVDPM